MAFKPVLLFSTLLREARLGYGTLLYSCAQA